jgi:hypothetical protein
MTTIYQRVHQNNFSSAKNTNYENNSFKNPEHISRHDMFNLIFLPEKRE